ncbi:hypothetical protein XU18_0165 [Perkinsela sp. CCAP 1560/4]|nr:hypothetical protein XU18_0165 [Perkinsela sp. CCAP 1560/4]|eukprot:KNH09480.1 hypothetical protein XU18_0165 [Perkinsela sp. CCAP 1560/4]
MFRQPKALLKQTKSTVVQSTRHPLSGSKKGRDYNYAYRTFGPFGYGVGKNQSKKDRTAVIFPKPYPPSAQRTDGPLSDVSRSLSKDWAPYALQDGGVLFAHPSMHQVLQWSHETLKEERKTTGLHSIVDYDRDAKIKTLLARNTIEAQPIEYWRKKHITQLLRHNMKISR